MVGDGQGGAAAEPAKPTAAGIYDVYLGGANHTQVEQEAAEQLRGVLPEAEAIAWANRSFHQRAVRWLAEQGVRQFVDLGAGLPTQDNTHEVVQRVAPDSRVLYVDHDAHTVARGQELVADAKNTEFVSGDAVDPEAVLGGERLRSLIDLDQPVALVCTAILHFVSDDRDPWGAIARYTEALAPGSYLVLSHVTADRQPQRPVQTLYGIYRNANEMIYLRNRDQVEFFFEGLDLVPPYDGADAKVSFVGMWGCEDPAEADDDTGRWLYCGVARRP